jgi:hypothetical protein
MPRPSRWFAAEDVLNGRVNLDGYPLRYILLHPLPSTGFRITFAGRQQANASADLLLSAVEFLESRGWELVNLDRAEHVYHAVMRRAQGS